MGKEQVKELADEYGLFDPMGNVWLGCKKGPVRYKDLDLARVAATMATKMLGVLIQATPYDPTPKKLRDIVNPKLSAIQALKLLEEGEL